MPLPNTRAPVLLLRAPNGSPDPYEAALTESGYRPFSVPVLETVLVNGEDLKGILKDGPSGGNGGDEEGERGGGYGGVVVTSSRAAEAWGKAVEEIANEVGSESEIGASAAPSWATTPFYAVGPSTAFALSSISSSHPSPTTIAHLCPTDIRGAYESGTAEKLAHFILHDIPESKRQHGKRLLYLTGDKNRETLPEILREGGLGLGSCKVYETRGSSRFEKELGEVVRGVDVEPDKAWWMNSAPRSLLAGLGAGMTEAVLAVTPSETIKTKLIDDAKRPQPQYRGLVHGTMSIVRQEGIRGIYRGLFPVMMRQGANSAIRFTTYATLKQFVQSRTRAGQQLPSGVTFGIGAIAGLVTVYTTMPLDVIKTRMQSLEARTQYRNSFHCAYRIFTEEGVRRFWTGTTPRLARLIMSGGIVFTIYEKVIMLIGGREV